MSTVVTPGAPEGRRVVVVIPAYQVADQIAAVLEAIPEGIDRIVVVDDASLDATGEIVMARARIDPRVILLTHRTNQGVGGAMVTGYAKAIELEADLVVKLDGDGQMPPASIPMLLWPLSRGEADFAKGNRFRDFHALRRMPFVRRIGNAMLSFLVKAATGYWNIFDPSNGFTAIRGDLLRAIDLEKLDRSYFFEISMLGELYLSSAVVRDVPQRAIYGAEVSHLSIARVLWTYPSKLARMLLRRLVLRYFLYDFSVVSLYLLVGLPLIAFGVLFGALQWAAHARVGVATPTGTVMLATLPVILGFQLLLSAIAGDLESVPREPRDRHSVERPPNSYPDR